MSAELIRDRIELYRFKELNGTFSGVCTIVYNDRAAFIKGMHGNIDVSDIKELKAHLLSRGVNCVEFVRKGIKGNKEIRLDL